MSDATFSNWHFRGWFRKTLLTDKLKGLQSLIQKRKEGKNENGMSFGAGGRERRAAYSCISSCGIKKELLMAYLAQVLFNWLKEKEPEEVRKV